MRILVENGTYDLRNMGDVAMLQIAVERLEELWPNAIIEVITNAPERLAKYCPRACALSPRGRSRWYKGGKLLGRFGRSVPKSVSRRFPKLEERIMHKWPLMARFWTRVIMKGRGIDIYFKEIQTFLEALLSAHIVVATGGGYITDAFRSHALMLLDTLEIATQFRIPTAMFSQGLGPIQDPLLWAKARAVLPRVGLIAVREGRIAISLLNSLGVAETQVAITGDDAIELAYKKRAEEVGTGIGVNLRVATYSEVDDEIIEIIRPVLQNIALKHRASLIPLPTHTVSDSYTVSDSSAIREILTGYDSIPDGKQILDSPHKICEQVRSCRVVVTGSYHAAVFALSQGIPVVGLAKCSYYIDKFMGLANQFGNDLKVVFLDDENLSETLTTAVETSYKNARDVRLRLTETAKKQIRQSKAAYQSFYDIVLSRKR